MKYKRMNAEGLLKGVLSSTFAALKLSIILVTLSFVINSLQGRPIDRVIAEFLMALWIFSIMTSVIAFFAAGIIGIPIVSLLLWLQMDDELIAAVIATLLMFLIIIVNTRPELFATLFITYSFYCGWSFMKGYKRSLS